MVEHEVSQLLVGGHRTGIIGLKAALEAVAGMGTGLTDEAITAELMRLLRESNYIVSSAEKAYAAAFLREFKRTRGHPVSEDPAGPIQIKVLGQGCPSCDKLEQDVMSVLGEIGLTADLEHVRDIREIAAYGVMGSPSLVIDGKVVSYGRVPTAGDIASWLVEA